MSIIVIDVIVINTVIVFTVTVMIMALYVTLPSIHSPSVVLNTSSTCSDMSTALATCTTMKQKARVHG